MNVGTITQLTNRPPRLEDLSAAFPCRAQSDCSPTDLDVSQRREKMWRDECTRIVNALADLAGLPRDPCPGWKPCVEKIKAMLANAAGQGREAYPAPACSQSGLEDKR